MSRWRPNGFIGSLNCKDLPIVTLQIQSNSVPTKDITFTLFVRRKIQTLSISLLMRWEITSKMTDHGMCINFTTRSKGTRQHAGITSVLVPWVLYPYSLRSSITMFVKISIPLVVNVWLLHSSSAICNMSVERGTRHASRNGYKKLGPST